MISMKMLGKVLRMCVRDKLSLHENLNAHEAIPQHDGKMAQNTICRRGSASALHTRVANKLTPYHSTLERAPKGRCPSDQAEPPYVRSPVRADQGLWLHRSYSRVTDSTRKWRGREGNATRDFVPLSFEDWRGLSS